MKGLLIAIEGCDGAGTTTQARILAETLAARQIPVHLTCQPSPGPVGQMIREVLGGKLHLPPESVALLFAADRVDHLERYVCPALDAGKVVVCDRWYHSSFAYNVDVDNVSGRSCLREGVAQDSEWIARINTFATRPYFTFFLDITAEQAAQRRAAANRAIELYDDVATQRKVVARYRQLLHHEPGILPIDGSQPIGEVARRIYVILEAALHEQYVQGTPVPQQ